MVGEMFWRKKKSQTDEQVQPDVASGAAQELQVFDVRSGATFEDVVSPEAADAAVREGRLEYVPILDPRFGFPQEGANQVPVPPGVRGALDRMHDVLVESVRSGKSVNLDFNADYKDDSKVPAAMNYECGEAGSFQFLIW